MIIEVLALLAVLTGGTAASLMLGLRGWPVAMVGFVLGTALQVLIGTLQVVVGAPTSPVLTLALTAGLPVVAWLVARRQGADVAVGTVAAAATTVGIVAGIGALRWSGFVSLTPDSYRYMSVGSLLADGRTDQALAFTLQSRLLAVPIVHAPANLGQEFYLPAATPLLAVATVGMLVWLCREGLRMRTVPAPMVASAALVGAALLVTNSRFLFHATYINGHLLFAALLLLAAGSAWLATGALPQRPRWATAFQIVAVMTLVVVRPEGSLAAGLVVLPTLADDRLPRGTRLAPLVGLGSGMAIWHGYVVYRYGAEGVTPPSSTTAMLGLGGAVLISAVGAWRLRARLPGARLLAVAEIGLWVALGAAVVLDRGVLGDSIYATIQNIALDEGGWGASLLLLGAVLVGVLSLTSTADRVYLRFPLTTFVPMAGLLPYLREGAYRAGPGDSLNRMLMHIVPLAILLAVSAVASQRWGLTRRARQDKRVLSSGS